MNDLNRKLHEARGLCWHEDQFNPNFQVKRERYVCVKCRKSGYNSSSENEPSYQYDTDLVAAFELVDEMRSKGWFFRMSGDKTTDYYAEFTRYEPNEHDETHWHEHSNPARAISLACAKALGITTDGL